ncbi:MAG: signal recognition particle-docking protein FtsY [Calditrichaceae bacterium]|nr:signal recognition particle-docking protein FtsY [Calditrichaceae bacterium]HES60101.1 signal recognition particle-docking protein FtsY [Caldithrix sp.]
MAFFKLKDGLKKTREGVFSKVTRLITGKRKIDEDFLEELEEILIAGDVGVDATLNVIDHIRDRVKKERYETTEELDQLIKNEVSRLLETPNFEEPDQKPAVILVVGVNGTGKTTSIAKLAYKLKEQGKSVLLAAGDTFRAAAIEQLCIWSERIGCDVIKHQQNSDPAAVVFDAVSAAKARNNDYLIIDTAGRLHTKSNLMTELEKIVRVIQRQIPEAPHEVILVLDAGNGQNALNQAREFVKAANVNSIFLTKLDGTAKGGVVLSIRNVLGIPVKYIGLGEKMTDMEYFNPKEFVEGLFTNE